MCGYVCIAFIDFLLEVKGLLDYKNVFSRNEYEKKYKAIPNIFNNWKK